MEGKVTEKRVGDRWMCSVCRLCWTVSTTLYILQFSFTRSPQNKCKEGKRVHFSVGFVNAHAETSNS